MKSKLILTMTLLFVLTIQVQAEAYRSHKPYYRHHRGHHYYGHNYKNYPYNHRYGHHYRKYSYKHKYGYRYGHYTYYKKKFYYDYRSYGGHYEK